MPFRIPVAWFVLMLGVAGFAGCSRLSPNRRAHSGESAGSSTEGAAVADYSSAAVKARIESHAHYAAAVLHEQNDEPELAAEEFYLAAMADPANESLVLEATGRLLRLRQGDKPGEKAAESRAKAVELLKKATANSRASGVLFARLGLIYSLMGKKELA